MRHQPAHLHPAAARATPLGSYPSFLPKDTLNQGTDTVLTGSGAARP